MNFDTAHRHQQALDPSALTTIRTTLYAIEQGIIDCRNAGVDPDTDPAARTRAEESWRRHKAPMAAYWKAVSVYAGHLARVLR